MLRSGRQEKNNFGDHITIESNVDKGLYALLPHIKAQLQYTGYPKKSCLRFWLLGRSCNSNFSVFKWAFRENQMFVKIHIVIAIVEQIMSAFENHFPFVDRTSQTPDTEENSWTNVSFDSLSYLRIIAGEQRLHVFIIARRWSLVSLGSSFVCRLLNRV